MEDSENSNVLLEDSQDEIKETEETVKKKNEAEQEECSSDSSEDSILKFRNEQEMKKKEDALPIRVLETPSKTRISFELNGMKVTLRKRPSHKRRAKTWIVYCHKEEKSIARELEAYLNSKNGEVYHFAALLLSQTSPSCLWWV